MHRDGMLKLGLNARKKNPHFWLTATFLISPGTSQLLRQRTRQISGRWRQLFPAQFFNPAENENSLLHFFPEFGEVLLFLKKVFGTKFHHSQKTDPECQTVI
jgi:hypothetical protein